MPTVTITREKFLDDVQGRTFADVVNDAEQPFRAVLDFFNDGDRQRRMEESEVHPDVQTQRSKRLRQSIGVIVRMIMEGRGWRKTGRKGSLGVRDTGNPSKVGHNTGGLAFWFIRAERYERAGGMPFRTVRQRCNEVNSTALKSSSPRSTPRKASAPKSTSLKPARTKR
jgi:hypothetical protein